jgi:hypothetical protein
VVVATIDEHDFLAGFSRWARHVRAHNAARLATSGVTAGLVLGVAASAFAWWSRNHDLRVHSWWFGACGLLVGVWLARRNTWSDQHVALFLDHKLGSKEAVTTALELQQSSASDNGAYRTVLRDARQALSSPPVRSQLPPITQRAHLFVPLAGAAIFAIGLVPLPPPPGAPPPPPGTEQVKLSHLGSLDDVIKLSQLDPEDEAQAKRLRELSQRAETLRKRLLQGMPEREALDEIAKLRDAVAHERQRIGTGKERAGLESALSQLRKNPQLDAARKALGDRDITAFDKKMRRLANQLEGKDRKRAQEALKKAAEAARKRGAQGVARALDDQRRRLAETGQHNDQLRALTKAIEEGLSEEAKRALREMNSTGDPEAARRLSEAIAKALNQLTEEERKRLAERLREQAQELDPNSGGSRSLSEEQMRQMAEKLATDEGLKQLAQQLRQQAQPKPPSPEAERQRQLDEAERGLGETERQLQGGTLMPLPGQGQNPGGPPGGPPAGPSGSPGLSRGGGPGQHDGTTKKVEGDELRAHARGPLSAGAPNPGSVRGRTPGRAGETANLRGEKELGRVGPSEVGAVERSEVPKEYREQVGRYFQP